MERFHIGEWYGRPFLSLTEHERVQMAKHRKGKAKMSKPEAKRLQQLEEKKESTGLTPREAKRLVVLQEKLEKQRELERPCPFRTDVPDPTCTKTGGVCSLMLYDDDGGVMKSVEGERGLLRSVCPYRFHQGDKIVKYVGRGLLQDPDPIQAAEVGFLESTGNLDSDSGEDVGRIDMILVESSPTASDPDWVALEIQAVYFSGDEMGVEFKYIRDTQGKLSMAQGKRRPDYRSCGPKRLMPQLQIKVPTLRRWGKKMVVVVDLPFFRSMGEMRTVPHVSNADIVWCVVDFVEVEGSPHFQIKVVEEHYVTLESAIEGLTGGEPVSLDEFEERIRLKTGN